MINPLVISGFVAFAISAYFLFTMGASAPWLAITLFGLNGALIFQHGVKWMQGRMDTFDPAGMIGLFGIVFFLFSPAYQIAADFWPFIPPLTYDTDWITLWALMNLGGIIIYLAIIEAPARAKPMTSAWVFNRRRFWIVMPVALAFCFAMQVYVFMQFGGIGGLVRTFTERQQLGLGLSANDPFDNLGLPLLFAESFKYLFAMTIVVWAKDKPFARSWFFFAGMMIVCLIVFIVFGGLRGSRSNTIFSLIFAAGMYHFWIRQIRMKTVLLGVAFILVFMNGYYWYKIAGSGGIEAIFNPAARQTYVAARQDPNLYVITRDLGRMDVQTLALREYHREKLSYTFGATYPTSVFTVIPTSIVPYKPTFLLEAKTTIVRGVGRFVAGMPRTTTIVLGLFGEAFINFSYPGVFVAFGLLAWSIRSIRRLIRTLTSGDARLLLLPALCLLPIQILTTDSGVVVMLIARALLVPTLVIFLSGRGLSIGRSSRSVEPIGMQATGPSAAQPADRS